MNISSMDTPSNRSEFERRFHLLGRQIKDGRFHIPKGYPVDSLLRVRSLPNGRLDFNSVDEMARLNANMMDQFTDASFLEQLKSQGEVEPEIDGEQPAGGHHV